MVNVLASGHDEVSRTGLTILLLMSGKTDKRDVIGQESAQDSAA